MRDGTPLFGGYLMVDWSAAGSPRTGPDSIWLAYHVPGAPLVLENPATRALAMVRVAEILDQATDAGSRVLAGFDFPFGYPAGLGQALGGDWRAVWAAICDGLTDGPDNANDRFDLAAKLNAPFPGDGPFWGNGLRRDVLGLPRKKPTGWGETLPDNLRLAEKAAKAAQEVWKLSGVGSVGGQALTGIAALENLRRTRDDIAIWPFEDLDGHHVLAEIFPSLVPVEVPDGQARDAAQVSVMARTLAALDADGILARMLAGPSDPVIRTHEAAILGQDQQDLFRHAAAAVQGGPAPLPMRPYEKDPKAIYAKSFATVQDEARLDRFPPGLRQLAIRVIHACGMVDVADRLAFSPDAFVAGAKALQAGAPILCDCEMVGAGIIRRYLPAGNDVIVTLNDPRVPDHATQIGNTRSAAAVEFWAPHLDGAVVAIGNAPTALFHLLELIDAGAPKPAVILGFPVGFVGAAESKAELAARPRGCDFVALRGRRGGSAIASAAVNALAAGLPELDA